MKEKLSPTFVDLFAGIGGFHEAFKGLGAECKFVCERDEAARATYQAFHGKSWGDEFLVNSPGSNHPPSFFRDITDLTLSRSDKRGNKGTRKIRKVMAGFNVDILCGGFPCQPFSQAGKRKGFDDETRGTLFYDICRIIRAKSPRAFFLENVRGMLTSGGVILDSDGEPLPYGTTLKTILDKLFSPIAAGGLGYHPPGGRFTKKRRKLGPSEVAPGVYLVKASDHGLPQNRQRVFIIGFKSSQEAKRMHLPLTDSLEEGGESLAKILKVSKVYMNKRRDSERIVGFTLRCGGKRSPISDRRNWDQYYVRSLDGKDIELTLTERQGLRLMGFPSERSFPEGVSYSQAMKQLGNSVAVPAIRDWGRKILLAMGYEAGQQN